MKLYPVRHGIAYEPSAPGDEDDVERPLTDKGRDKMKRISKALQDLNIEPDVILSSPYLRTEPKATPAWLLTPWIPTGIRF